MTTSANATSAACNEFGKQVYSMTIQAKSASLEDLFLESEQLKSVSNKIGHQFSDINLLIRSFTHRSFTHEYTTENRESYERLEFLGDSVLGSFTSFTLFKSFPDFSEGKLSKLRSALVNENSLAQLGRYLGIEKCALLGKGELQNPLNDSLVCDLFESLIGAITLDASIDKAFKSLENIITGFEAQSGVRFFCESKALVFDPKTTLQELTMKKFKSLPVYESKDIEGGFIVDLIINNKKIISTTCASKKQAMKDLAKECIENNLIDKINNGESAC